MGPLLWRDNYSLYWPGDPDAQVVPNYYSSEYVKNDDDSSIDDEKSKGKANEEQVKDEIMPAGTNSDNSEMEKSEREKKGSHVDLKAIDTLPWFHPRRLLATLRYVLFYGITRDVIAHQSKGLDDVHARAPQFDNKVEHLWTTAQVCSAMIMSIAHGANDVSNAIGPFTTEYLVWKTGVASEETGTPIWIKIVGGLGLGFGFWTFGCASSLTPKLA